MAALLVEGRSWASGDASGGSWEGSLLMAVVATMPVGVGGPSKAIMSRLYDSLYPEVLEVCET